MAKNKSNVPVSSMVPFHFEDRMYQIDADHKKVYRRFVEIETSKASEILTNWRASHVGG